MNSHPRRMITREMVREANRAAIEGRRYAPHIEEAASRLPKFTAEEINQAWKRANGRQESNLSV